MEILTDELLDYLAGEYLKLGLEEIVFEDFVKYAMLARTFQGVERFKHLEVAK